MSLFKNVPLISWLAAAIIGSQFLLWQPPVESSDKSVGLMPVFFVTDRDLLQDGVEPKFGKQSLDRTDVLTYGIKPVVRKEGTSGEFANASLVILGPSGVSKEREASFTAFAERYNESVLGTEFDKFKAVIEKTLKDTGGNELVLFVHGCCVNFKEAARQSSDLQAAVRKPVIMYDWGTPSGNYAGSNLAFPRSQARFNTFLTELRKSFPEARISIVGLSLGNMLFDNFAVQVRPEEVGKKFDDVIFARADMDSIAFKNHIDEIAAHANNISVYAAKNDFSTNISGLLRWIAWPTAHGERVGHIRAALQTDPRLTIYDVSDLKLNHLLPVELIAERLRDRENYSRSIAFDYLKQGDGVIRVRKKKTRPNEEQNTSVGTKAQDL